ncbi:hypothetical protein MLD38_002173 [Melastoma candidum]|uniref:Uncharacterized protein n=1 Tax=Melastoma candidum TaxID=119954 RepID=A0ACB9SFP2_9MYRT|nr:hypothetical protein MLD38_002173 [Melastoma candidum]
MGNFCSKGKASVDHKTTPFHTRKYSIPDESKEEKGLPTPTSSTPSSSKGGARAVPRNSDGGGTGKDTDSRPSSLAEPTAVPASSSWKGMVPNVKVFTLAELKSVTRDFKPDTILGEGGFGRVFKGWIDPKTYAPAKQGVGIPVAVKKSNPDSDQGLREWQAEVKFLGKFSHPNLVKLMGFCWEDGQFLLVYEYVQRGSLDRHLFRRGAEPLPWELRLKIAIGAARGLDFLHTSEKSVIYRDFKSSNILLDADYNAKLSDFGLAKLGPPEGDSHVTTQVIGTFGYAAPEYVATGHLYLKSDVYGFGVVLLELLTGLRAQDSTRPSYKTNLVQWAKPFLNEKKQVRKIVDSKLDGRYSIKGATIAAETIVKCLEGDPKNRPGMDEVLTALEHALAISPTDTPKDSRAKRLVGSGQHNRHQDINRSPLHGNHNGGAGPSRINSS